MSASTGRIAPSHQPSSTYWNSGVKKRSQLSPLPIRCARSAKLSEPISLCPSKWPRNKPTFLPTQLSWIINDHPHKPSQFVINVQGLGFSRQEHLYLCYDLNSDGIYLKEFTAKAFLLHCSFSIVAIVWSLFLAGTLSIAPVNICKKYHRDGNIGKVNSTIFLAWWFASTAPVQTCWECMIKWRVVWNLPTSAKHSRPLHSLRHQT